jgi:hypothetical protein
MTNEQVETTTVSQECFKFGNENMILTTRRLINRLDRFFKLIPGK